MQWKLRKIFNALSEIQLIIASCFSHRQWQEHRLFLIYCLSVTKHVLLVILLNLPSRKFSNWKVIVFHAKNCLKNCSVFQIRNCRWSGRKSYLWLVPVTFQGLCSMKHTRSYMNPDWRINLRHLIINRKSSLHSNNKVPLYGPETWSLRIDARRRSTFEYLVLVALVGHNRGVISITQKLGIWFFSGVKYLKEALKISR